MRNYGEKFVLKIDTRFNWVNEVMKSNKKWMHILIKDEKRKPKLKLEKTTQVERQEKKKEREVDKDGKIDQ